MVELYELFMTSLPRTQPKIDSPGRGRTLRLPVPPDVQRLFARSPDQFLYRGKHLYYVAAQRRQKSALDSGVQCQCHYLRPTGVPNSLSAQPKLEFGVGLPARQTYWH